MPDEPLTASPTPAAIHRPWRKTAALIAVMLLCVCGALAAIWFLGRAGLAALHRRAAFVENAGRQLTSLAAAFRQGTVRQEFFSSAAEITTGSAFQFATLRQNEVFRREETGSIAWGLIPLPTVVVQAQAPVEYTYRIDFENRWQFVLEGSTLTVTPSEIVPNTPAIDVSALEFYTLGGSLFGADKAVREALKKTLTQELHARALANVNLVREAGRQKLASFVEKWLREKFTDARELRVQVVFPDEKKDAGKSTLGPE